MIKFNLIGTCKECMVLNARTDITDKDSNRLSQDKSNFVHHILVADQGQSKV
jgi:hypothetical protein